MGNGAEQHVVRGRIYPGERIAFSRATVLRRIELNFFALFDLRDLPRFIPPLLNGLKYTLIMTLIIMALGLVAGLPIALMRTSSSRFLRAISSGYVQIMRGTPLLVQLIWIYYVLPFFGIALSAWAAGIIGMSANYAAWISEIYRSGIAAIDKGQVEAASAIGMSRRLSLRLVILPQAFRIVIPPLGNIFIGLFKDTSLLSVVTVQELLFRGQLIVATTFKSFQIYTLVAVIYLAVCWPAAILVGRLEQRLRIPGVAVDDGYKRRWFGQLRREKSERAGS
jgi:His/Glu/Gln/Arg/opine family amino acid ABC transporter permease subunit